MDWSDPHFDDDSEGTESSSVDTNTDEDDLWRKVPFVAPDNDFDQITVIPQQPFDESDGPLEYFSKFVNDELIKMIVAQTNLYAQQNGSRNWYDTTAEEIRCVIGLLIGQGIHNLPTVKHYWSTDPLFRVQSLADAMPRSRFMKLLCNLHLNDNTTAAGRGSDGYDKLHKIRPLAEMINKQFQEQAVSSGSQSIDEAMIIFKGRSAFRQYMPMKPAKRGYKVWVIADSKTGYVHQVDIYTGKGDSASSGEGLGSRVVRKLTEPLRNSFTHVTFNNFSTSIELMEELFKDKIYATGTIRANRRGMPTVANVKESMKKGQSKWLVHQNTSYVKWMDTKIVHIVSTAFNPSSILEASRTQKDGTRLTVTWPKPILEYTKRMGGVDRFDRMRSLYAISRKSKKRWIRIFYFFTDAAVVNAFILYLSVHPMKRVSILEFRVALFRSLVRDFCSRERRSSLKGSSFVRYSVDKSTSRRKLPGVPDDVRFQGNHYPQQVDSFRRCRLCSSRKHNKRSRIICNKCQVALCLHPCFAEFHRK